MRDAMLCQALRDGLLLGSARHYCQARALSEALDNVRTRSVHCGSAALRQSIRSIRSIGGSCTRMPSAHEASLTMERYMQSRFGSWMVAWKTLCWTLGCVLACVVLVGCSEDRQSFVYVMTNPDGPNSIDAFTRDRSSGRLTYFGRFQTGGTGDPTVGGFQQHALVSDDKSLYAVNPGSDSISAFAIQGDGSLRLLNTVPSGGRRPVSLALRNTLLYVANAGNVPAQESAFASYSGFRVRRDGSLESLANSTRQISDAGVVLSDVVFNAPGDVLIGIRMRGDAMDSFSVGSDGLLTNQRTTSRSGGPCGGLFSPAASQRLFVSLSDPESGGPPAPGVALYTVDRTGSVALNGTFTDTALRDPCWMAITTDGIFLWTSAFTPRTITLFAVNGNGTLTFLSVWNPEDSQDNPQDPARPLVLGSTDIALDAEGEFLYQLRAFDVSGANAPVVPRIEVLRRRGNRAMNAGLERVQRLDLPSDLETAGVMGLVIVNLGN